MAHECPHNVDNLQKSVSQRPGNLGFENFKHTVVRYRLLLHSRKHTSALAEIPLHLHVRRSCLHQTQQLGAQALQRSWV